MKEIGIGILGFGTVGAGVVKGLTENADLIAGRSGARLVVRRIADLDIESDRGVAVDAGILTTDADSVIDDLSVDIVVELIGGTGIARKLVTKALEAGKPVVTANKALLAEHGCEIFRLSSERNTDIYYGASVGGGIPIIRALREGLVANRIDSILGILNGTCNYILTRMEKEQLPFDTALKEAQEAGYAEADPALDIDGVDTAHKAVILASLAYGFNVGMENVSVEGVRDISELDIRYARDLGYRIKLMAVIKNNSGKLEVRVHPTLVHLDHMLASVSGVFNAVMVCSSMTGTTLYYGRGAGCEPTAATVIGDIVDVARNLISGSPCRLSAMPENGSTCEILDFAEITTRYYVRLSLPDIPGTFAQISAVLGKHGISIASVLQKEEEEQGNVPVIIVTHQSKEKDLNAALQEICDIGIAGSDPVRMRIED